jgi:copper chaperone CopZ
MTSAAYRVTGMTSDHCVRVATEELSNVAGVVTVDGRFVQAETGDH